MHTPSPGSRLCSGTGATALGGEHAWAPPSSLSDLIRRGFKDGKTECDVLDKILEYPFIAIDELGRTKGSDAERNWLSYLVDKAHTRGIRLMLISNRQTAKNLPAERKGEAFEYFVDNDVISRLHSTSRVVEINGRDRRN